jgi:lipoyl(octanoyl) transferase
MSMKPVANADAERTGLKLQLYLLGCMDFEAALSLQRRLVFEVASDRRRAALLLCEHSPPLITVGRQGSRTHILCGPEELRARQWKVRWVNRGGGCLLHVPGQLAIYPILPLDRLGLGVQEYLERLQQVVTATLADFSLRAETRDGRPGVWVGGRPIAGLGIAVRNWVAYYGAYLNINPALDRFRLVSCGGSERVPMTSVERERRGPLRPALVRERLVEHFAAQFSFDQIVFFSDHPSLSRKARADAFAPHA